jgi:hypothetical protein
VQDTKSTESYEYPVELCISGKRNYSVSPGTSLFDQYISDTNRFSVILSTRRLGDEVTIESVCVPATANQPINVDVEATLESVSISVGGTKVIEYLV